MKKNAISLSNLVMAVIVIPALLAGYSSITEASRWDIYPGQSIQDAINNAVDGDEIIVHPGTYYEHINFNGKSLTLRSDGDGNPGTYDVSPDTTIIDANQDIPLVAFYSGEGNRAIIDGFTIRNGSTGIDILNGSSPTIRNCKILFNSTAGGGGGMSISNSSPTLINCIISGNEAEKGGGIDMHQSSPRFINCTFSKNTAQNGGAVYCSDSSSSIFTNCILWGNLGHEITIDGSSSVTISHCNIQGEKTGINAEEGSAVNWITGVNIDADPYFVGEWDYHLHRGSPCIDSGTNTGAPTKDQDGVRRPQDGDADRSPVCDIGAYEYEFPVCEGDFDKDGDVNGSDLAVFVSDFGRIDCNSGPLCEGDFDKDGDVDGSDLAVFASDFGRTGCPGLIEISPGLIVSLGYSSDLEVSLSPPAPLAGATVTLTSSDPNTLSIEHPGTLFIPEGETTGYLEVNGLSRGTAVIWGKAPGYLEGIGHVKVNQWLINLPDTLDIPFGEEAVIPITIGPDPAPPVGITIDIKSSNPSSVNVLTPCITIPEGAYTANMKLKGIQPGTAIVTASAPKIAQDTINVKVNPQPGIDLGGLPTKVGSGLQKGWYPVTLDEGSHGGVTVIITSSDPNVALVSPDKSTPGSASIEMPVPDGNTSANYYIQGVEGATGEVEITASASGFTQGSGQVQIIKPALRINGLSDTITTLSPEDAFSVSIGLPNSDNTGLSENQDVRAGGVSLLTVTVTNSNGGAGRLVTNTLEGQGVTVGIAAGDYHSPDSVSEGGVAFYPSGSGNTIVSATIPGFIATTAALVEVQVSAPGITMVGLPSKIGSGLQHGLYKAILGGRNHGGVTLRIASSDPNWALVSPDKSTPGSDFIDLPIADGQNSAGYYIQVIEGAPTEKVRIAASAPRFTEGSGQVQIVQPALRINGLPDATTASSPDAPFSISIGIPNSDNSGISLNQSVRAGGAALAVTVTNSNGSAGRLVTSALTGQSVTVRIAAGSYSSPEKVGEGGVAFDPIGVGNTIVSATIPGFIATTSASVDVEVSE